jgi:hypothetical protein
MKMMVTTEGIRRRGRRLKQLLGGLRETRRQRDMEEEAIDRPLCRTLFAIRCEPVLRRTME